MASSTPFTPRGLGPKPRFQNKNSPARKEPGAKERICNMVLRDEDEETDDEDLTINSNSPVLHFSLYYLFDHGIYLSPHHVS